MQSIDNKAQLPSDKADGNEILLKALAHSSYPAIDGTTVGIQ
jgi:hypothetical protein